MRPSTQVPSIAPPHTYRVRSYDAAAAPQHSNVSSGEHGVRADRIRAGDGVVRVDEKLRPLHQERCAFLQQLSVPVGA